MGAGEMTKQSQCLITPLNPATYTINPPRPGDRREIRLYPFLVSLHFHRRLAPFKGRLSLDNKTPRREEKRSRRCSLTAARGLRRLPRFRARIALERPYDVGGYPTSVVTALLGDHSLLSDVTGIHLAGEKCKEVPNTIVAVKRIAVTPSSVLNKSVANSNRPVLRSAFPFAESGMFAWLQVFALNVRWGGCNTSVGWRFRARGRLRQCPPVQFPPAPPGCVGQLPQRVADAGSPKRSLDPVRGCRSFPAAHVSSAAIC